MRIDCRAKTAGKESAMKKFNTTALCIPSEHYVDLTERVEEIREMADAGKYFLICRPRQYG